MNIGYLIVGWIFLFNPYINIIDILPDFIGYFFILKGLFKLSDLERNLLSARKKFKSAMWISVARFALVFASPIFDATWYLILSFTLGILECIYLIPAFIDMFYGISYLEDRCTNHRARFESKPKFGGVFDKTEFESGTAYFEIFTRKGKDNAPHFSEELVFFPNQSVPVFLSDAGFASRLKQKITYDYETVEARTMSVIFVIVRAAASCIPELTAIAGTGTGYVQSNPIDDYSGARGVLVVFFALFALVIGILWLVRMIRYFRIFCADKTFVSVLSEKYEREVAPNQGLWIKRKSLSFCAVSTAAYAFLLSFRIDWFLFVPRFLINIFGGGYVDELGIFVIYDLDAFFPIPEFLFGVMMIFAAYAAKNFAQRKGKIIQKSVFFIVSSFASYIAMFLLSWNYGKMIYPYEEKGYLAYFAVYVLLFAVSMVAFVFLSGEKKRVYTRLGEEIAALSCPHVHEFSDRKRNELIEDFGRKIKNLHILELVYAIVSVLLQFCMPFTEDYDICGLFWLFRMAFGVALIIYSTLLTDALQKEIEKIVE